MGKFFLLFKSTDLTLNSENVCCTIEQNLTYRNCFIWSREFEKMVEGQQRIAVVCYPLIFVDSPKKPYEECYNSANSYDYN